MDSSTTYMDGTAVMTKSFWNSLQFHQEADSPYLYKLVQDQIWFQDKHFLWMEFDKQIDTIKINKSNYTCNEYNTNGFMNCMENYYSKKMGCTLPWSLNTLKHGSMNICEGKEKFKQFKNIAMNILKPEESTELINSGCFIPNCLQRSWKIKKERDVDEKNENGEPATGFELELAEPSNVLVREEVQLYTLINFFAEVGGYLGLLLGESLLSYIITSSKWIQVLWAKCKANYCKKSEEETLPQ